MSLRISRGNMYEFVNFTWNLIKGICKHGCKYCYVSKMNPNLKDKYIDEKELKEDLGKDNFIFVGSSIDAWAEDIPSDWIRQMLDYCDKFDNRYLFQSKNPERFLEFTDHPVYQKSVFCTTIETNKMNDMMGNTPEPRLRAEAMGKLADMGFETYVTVEPVMEFDYEEMVELILQCKPKQVNIGKNTNYKVALVEPIPQKILTLGKRLEAEGIKVVFKKNIHRYIYES